ncbi:glucose-6-phosphate dehydrogenase [Carnobacteriaceae bacterium zg-ZUI78]|uniref:glucose-6-phosphate dehydrogenase n=1 Tax=Granulicatella sp. zg-84 TaxID=2678503 RepID=UPI00175472FD|nr:glucose-6-phosphate dehydrogenase [Granulicatella sp. zg-84]MBS4749894.1 glucose-6-phosphate dehydrogenase [Carnobacteriaceae bacterium zg-ZUI78]QMI86147.1 glucose-6-phosphate dehydrogenase [Carnobacteriaceae bacterium zg-84]
MTIIQEIPVLITIFGGTGDLAKRKLYPALFRLFKKGHLKNSFAVIGTARREWSNDYYQEVVLESIQQLSNDDAEKKAFASHFYYLSHNVEHTQHYDQLKHLADTLDATYHTLGNRVFYLSVAPNFFGTIAQHIKTQHLLTSNGFNRLIIEKPFGHNLQTAIELNNQLTQTFDENQIFRIDHYLGKEMVQNITALRCHNALLKACWHAEYIDNIQITLAESVGFEDRAGYYDKSGALRDMVQNHIFQILSLLSMELPETLNGENIREEKASVLRHLRMYDENAIKEHFVRAQYIGNDDIIGYKEEPDIDAYTRTETFVAGKIFIDNARWKNIPFYIRTGKRLSHKDTSVHIQFKPTSPEVAGNLLSIHIQPEEQIRLFINTKEQGLSHHIQMIDLTKTYTQQNAPEAYERLILECLHGDMTNFAHREEIELSWAFIDRIRHAWDNDTQSNIPTYTAGSMGPIESIQLLEKDGFHWINQ